MPRHRNVVPLASVLFLLGAIGAPFIAPRSLRAEPDYPKPNAYPTSWELKFTHEVPKRISVDVPNSATPKAYWYMTYTVTNDGDKEQRFYPQIDLLTTDGNVHGADENIPKRVFDEIKLRERNGFLEEFTTINGSVRLGPAEARDGVAIWPETTPRMEHFSIFATGLCGEAVAMKLVDGKPTKIDVAVTMKDGKLVPLDNDNSATDLYNKDDVEGHIKKDLTILRKTLQLNFFIRGDEVYPGEDEVNKDSEEWIMR